MAHDNALYLEGFVAGADLSSSQYLAVKLASTAGEVVVCSSTLDKAVGILQNDPTDGQPASVVFGGISKARLGPTDVAAGDYLSVNTTGQLEDLTTDNHQIVAFALHANSAANDVADVMVLGPMRL